MKTTLLTAMLFLSISSVSIGKDIDEPKSVVQDINYPLTKEQMDNVSSGRARTKGIRFSGQVGEEGFRRFSGQVGEET